MKSKEWHKRQSTDLYVKKATELGYVSRSAFKLIEIEKKYNILRNSNSILEFRSTFDDNTNKHFLYNHKPSKIHLAQAMSSHFNLNIEYKNIENEIFFSKEEIEIYEKKIQLPNNFALIKSFSKSRYTKKTTRYYE